MKIGIVTYHRAHNYGAVMQALATRFVLEEMGHEAYYVDYWPDYHKEKYQVFPKNKFKKLRFLQKIKFLITLCLYYKSKKKRIENFETFFQTHIYPYCRPVDDSFDVVIYGSDQIWRKQKEIGDYNPFYFGQNNLNTKRHISYAASMGILPDNESDKAKVKELVTHLDKISVREEGLLRLLHSLGRTDVDLSLDPTLLLTADMWDKYLPTIPYEGKKYILVYMLADVFDLVEIKRFAKNKGLSMIVLRGGVKTAETKTNITNSDPYGFLRLMKNAEYVFCASFHGVAFSIIYGKQFYCSFKNNSGRAISLLRQLNLSDRLLPPQSSIPRNVSMIDYEKIRIIIEELREKSLDYLAKTT